MNVAPYFVAGQCGERYCPVLCLFLEGLLCAGPSISSTRAHIMNKYDIRTGQVKRRNYSKQLYV